MFGTIIAAIAAVATLWGPGEASAVAAVPAEHVTVQVDTLAVDEGTVPELVWNAMLDNAVVMSSPEDGAERLYVPVGVQVDVPGGWVRATPDGWTTCVDGTTTGDECSDHDSGEFADDLSNFYV